MWENSKVLRVINGNTFEVVFNRKKIPVRLANVFPDEEHDEEAMEALERLILGKHVEYRTLGQSYKGGKIAQVRIPGGVHVNRAMRQELNLV